MRVGLNTQFSFFGKRHLHRLYSPVSIGRNPQEEEKDRVNKLLEQERQEDLGRVVQEDGATQKFRSSTIDKAALRAEEAAARTHQREKDIMERSQGSQILLD